MERQQVVERDAGWAVFLALLVGVAAKRLYNPRSSASDVNGVSDGEFDEISLVPTALVRAAVSAAGGNMGVGTAGGNVISVDDRPLGLLGTGETMDTYLGSAGWQVLGYRWAYGEDDRKTFEPHLDLDGVEFTEWDDAALMNGGDFPATAYYYPGDHDGCRCLVEHLYGQEQ
jgi:hypothetical protein